MDSKHTAEFARMDHKHFVNVIQDFTEADADFAPQPGMMTVSQMIRHVALTVTWFREGAWGAGFDLDFEKMHAAIAAPATLAAARRQLDEAFTGFADFLEGQTMAELAAPMPDNPIFGTAPRMVVLRSNCDHTAHHRGALSVYLRLLGKTPRMPYA